MKTKYKYIEFKLVKHSIEKYICYNLESKDILGYVFFHPIWQGYVFNPLGITIFNKTCLDDISYFISQLNNVKLKTQKEDKNNV